MGEFRQTRQKRYNRRKRDGLYQGPTATENATTAPRFKILTDDDLDEMPSIPWLVRVVLPATGIAAIFGPSGCGKSFLTLDLLASVAGGDEWFGCRVKSAPVLYIGLEGESGVAQRVKARRVKHGPCHGLRYLLTPLDIRNQFDQIALIEAVKAAGVAGGVLCIDTLNRAAPGMDENSSQDMGEVIGAAKTIQAALGGLVLLVHHTGKDSNKGLRGHSSLIAALDCALEVSREADRRAWRVFKAKDGEDGKPPPVFLTDCILADNAIPFHPACAPEKPHASVFGEHCHPSRKQRVVWDAGRIVFRLPDIAPPDAPNRVRTRPSPSLGEAIKRNRDSCATQTQTERTQSQSPVITRGNL